MSASETRQATSSEAAAGVRPARRLPRPDPRAAFRNWGDTLGDGQVGGQVLRSPRARRPGLVAGLSRTRALLGRALLDVDLRQRKETTRLFSALSICQRSSARSRYAELAQAGRGPQVGHKAVMRIERNQRYGCLKRCRGNPDVDGGNRIGNRGQTTFSTENVVCPLLFLAGRPAGARRVLTGPMQGTVTPNPRGETRSVRLHDFNGTCLSSHRKGLAFKHSPPARDPLSVGSP